MLNEYNALLGEEPRDGVATKLCLREMMDYYRVVIQQSSQLTVLGKYLQISPFPWASVPPFRIT
jgi:hypothetical protein